MIVLVVGIAALLIASIVWFALLMFRLSAEIESRRGAFDKLEAINVRIQQFHAHKAQEESNGK